MLSLLAELLAPLAEFFFWLRWGPRHEPPRDQMSVLGDLNSRTEGEGHRETR